MALKRVEKMKNKIGILMIVAALVLVVSTAFAAAECAGVMGDLNKDGLVNNYDVEAIQKMIAGQDAPDLCGDLDGDSIIAPGDYAKLRLLYVGDC